MNLELFSKRKFNLKRAVWLVIQDYFFRFSPYPLNNLRCSILRLFGAGIGKRIIIRPSVRIDSPWNLTMGDYSWIGENVLLNSVDRITIGKHCCISQGCLLSSATHDYTKENFNIIKSPISIGNGVWIGAGSMIHPGIKVGNNAIIGAMSNVLKDIKEGTINFGNPCRFVRKR